MKIFYVLTSTVLISLPTGTKIFNWLSTYLGNACYFLYNSSTLFLGLIFLLMFTIGGSTGIILGNAAVDLGLHDTYYVVAHFHFVLSLGAVIAIFGGIMFYGSLILGSNIIYPSSSSTTSFLHLVLLVTGFLLTFAPMHFLGFNAMPRRIPDFPDSFHSWNFLSSIGSGITILSFAMFLLFWLLLLGTYVLPSHIRDYYGLAEQLFLLILFLYLFSFSGHHSFVVVCDDIKTIDRQLYPQEMSLVVLAVFIILLNFFLIFYYIYNSAPDVTTL